MRDYLRSLPSQPVAVRRRFVVFATALSFLVIVLLWGGLLATGRRRAPAPPAEATPVAPAAASAPVAAPVVNVEDLSVNLLRAFGSSPAPAR